MRRTATFAAMLALAAGLLIPTAGAQTGASIQIVAPRNGSGVSGKMMVVEVRVQNFMLNPLSIGKARMLGEGYWRVFVDGKFAGVSADEVISIPNDTFPSLPAGKHTIKAALYNNDHSPVPGGESSEITITIPQKSPMSYAPGSGNPGIKIVVPRNKATTSPYVVVWVRIKGLKENPMGLGKAARPGEGNWRLYVDGQLAGVSTTTVADVVLPRGKHILGASLRNNDHSPMKGASSDQVSITVK
ncbi:MAG: hypothetical protein E6H04_04470 [Bacillati bacterium ANGP1]|uniref:Ig-like domain repeat protein n=1 Tax=Candidatus Segetimicrobium genomatis TaxID=2569760 RepID=A0A537JHM5_9BACT|nr:MAG: hypothetical protein E6H04_04470 [Terrabacteria group bacterium ANGP1]